MVEWIEPALELAAFCRAFNQSSIKISQPQTELQNHSQISAAPLRRPFTLWPWVGP